jgi:cell fate (sporulation/competence/biofilm development) regulator YlbF (YheA/YmcA/DUF963 family)
MDNDIDLLHFCIKQGVSEHRDLREFTTELRSLFLEAVMALENEDKASELLEKFNKAKEKHPCSVSFK